MEQEEVLEEVVEQPVEEPVEQPVEQPESVVEPMTIYTSGKWELLEKFMPQEMEVGKTYHIKVEGHCQFMISATKPTVGITTNEITYTKQDGSNLWIKTGE